MSSRVTDLDTQIASNIKAMRKANTDLSMASVARFLGITYQSYQALEAGRVSFRASTLVELSKFYGVPVTDLILGHVSEVNNIDKIANIVLLLKDMPSHNVAEIGRFALAMSRIS